MTPEAAIAAVRSYYDAYRADDEAATTSELEALLHADFRLESPLVDTQPGGGLEGAPAVAAALRARPFLAGATIEAEYAALDGAGVATLIRFPSPVGVVVQSEHFDLDPDTGRITRLRSYYDPRKLLGGG